jgi:ABC transporter
MTQKAVGNAYLIGPNYAAGNDMMARAKSTFKGKVVGEDYTRWRHRVEPPRSGPIVDAGEGRGHVPGLAKRATTMARQLSGDEQQMLAIGRALMTNPRLLVLDEATEGLAPPIREEIWRCLTALKRAGQSDLRHRQECRRADRDRGPPLHHRTRPHQLERNVARACGRP